ncbi:maltose ABC transporter substrate-binding protein [Actinocorallia libanotica]|uniref:Extracellular solute-binding protein n=1 Tax=Actinocorallia libanotica TaxID=46162 RepID=A0ABP4B0F7_9ACTN
MRRPLPLLAGALAFGLLLTACGGAEEPEDSPGSQSKLVIWADQKRAEVLKPLAEDWAAKNGVKAEVVGIAQNQQQTFTTASQAGQGPDVMVGAHDWIGNLVQNGLIDPVQLPPEQMSGYVDIARKAVTYQGQVYGVPYAVESLVVYRNTDLVPEAPESFDDLVDTGRELKAAGKVKEIAGYPVSQQDGQSGDTYHMYPLFTSGGGALFATTEEGYPDPGELGVGAPASVKAFERIAEFGEKGQGALKRSFTSDNATAAFAAGETAFLIDGSWRLTDVRKAGVKYALSPVPGFEKGEPARSFVGVQSFFVASKGKSKTLAQEFVTNTLASPEVARTLYEAEPRTPALKSLIQEELPEDPDLAQFQAAAEAGDPLPSIPQMVAVWGPFNTLIHAVVKGEPVAPAVEAAGEAIAEQLKS